MFSSKILIMVHNPTPGSMEGTEISLRFQKRKFQLRSTILLFWEEKKLGRVSKLKTTLKQISGMVATWVLLVKNGEKRRRSKSYHNVIENIKMLWNGHPLAFVIQAMLFLFALRKYVYVSGLVLEMVQFPKA